MKLGTRTVLKSTHCILEDQHMFHKIRLELITSYPNDLWTTSLKIIISYQIKLQSCCKTNSEMYILLVCGLVRMPSEYKDRFMLQGSEFIAHTEGKSLEFPW